MTENDVLYLILWGWAILCLTAGLGLVVNSFRGGNHVDSGSTHFHLSYFRRAGIVLGPGLDSGQTDTEA